ncbi:hypothetical protein IID24_04195 [Patescibacteria group bacterium]|nr:hypothetical protein [Patescibacteria group bacterium]
MNAVWRVIRRIIHVLTIIIVAFFIAGSIVSEIDSRSFFFLGVVFILPFVPVILQWLRDRRVGIAGEEIYVILFGHRIDDALGISERYLQRILIMAGGLSLILGMVKGESSIIYYILIGFIPIIEGIIAHKFYTRRLSKLIR